MSRRKPLDEEGARALGARLREARGDQTQANFSAYIGIDRATLANYESGRRIPNDEVLKRYEEVSGRSAQDLFFGTHRTPFEVYMKNVNRMILDRQLQRPGFIPKFTISDDEIALIKAYRLAALNDEKPNALQALDLIVQAAMEIVEASPEVPIGEGSVNRLRIAIDRGHLEEGFDPDAAFFTTFEEERGP